MRIRVFYFSHVTAISKSEWTITVEKLAMEYTGLVPKTIFLINIEHIYTFLFALKRQQTSQKLCHTS